MVKVRPNAPVGAGTSVGLTAARNEFVSFQVVVNGGDTGAHNVRASFVGLTGATLISAPDITLYRVGFLNIETATPPNTLTGLWPDPLIPDVDEIASEKRNAFPFDVPANEARSIWVDVHVPEGAAPGTYRGSVSVLGNEFAVQVPVSLDVVNVLMPSTPSLSTAFLITQGQVCAAHASANCDAVLARYQVMALEHRVTLTNVFPSDLSNWDAFDGRYGPFLDGTVPSRLPGARMTTAQCPRYQDPAASASNCAAFAAHLAQEGWGDRAFYYTNDDEPHGQTLADGGTDYSDALYRAQLVHRAAPHLRTMVTTTYQRAAASGLLGAFDILSPVVNWMYGDADPYNGDQRSVYNGFAQTPQHEVWMYQSCMSQGCGVGSSTPENRPGSAWPSYMVDSSAARNRAMQWIDFRERVTAELYYDTASALTTAWTNQFNPSFNGNGDGNLFYPGTPMARNGQPAIGGATDVPVASIRLKMIRQGMQDFEWLKMVSDAGDPNFALTTANAVFPTPYQVGDDGTVFDKARAALIARLLVLRPNGYTGQGGASLADGSAGSHVSLMATARACSSAPGSVGIWMGLVLLGLVGWKRRTPR